VRPQDSAFFTQLAFGHSRQFFWVLYAVNHGLEYHSPGYPNNVGGDAAEFNIGSLQDLLDAADDPAPLPDEDAAVAYYLSKLSLRAIWNIAAAQQTVPQQIGNPFRVFDIGLPPRHRFDMLGVYHEQRETIFQEIVDRFPVYPCAFHGHMGDFEVKQPLLEFQQVFGHRAKGPGLSSLGRDGMSYHTFLWTSRAPHRE